MGRTREKIKIIFKNLTFCFHWNLRFLLVPVENRFWTRHTHDTLAPRYSCIRLKISSGLYEKQKIKTHENKRLPFIRSRLKKKKKGIAKITGRADRFVDTDVF